MTKREFATLVFRVLGVYCVINAFGAMQPLAPILSVMRAGMVLGQIESAFLASIVLNWLLQLALGLFLFFRAPHLAVSSVGAEDGTIVIEPTSGRFLILWGIGLYLLAMNVPHCATLLGKLAIGGYWRQSYAEGFFGDIFQPFARALIGLYMFRAGNGHLMRWRPPHIESIPHPRDWGRDPNWPRDEQHDQT
jgi:hypothetical protein